MYPHRTPIIQFETRRHERKRGLGSIREHGRTGPDSTVARVPAGPPRYKLALLTWAGAYAVVTLVLALFGPAMASWPLVLRTLVLSVTMVVALTWFVMPRLTRLCRPWLSPSG
jgi:antibiotic biosynthesis monooxygenase (ABM) superfamily enzyme